MTTLILQGIRDAVGQPDGGLCARMVRAGEISPTIFFDGDHFETALARRICMACECADPCFAWALSVRDLCGVWGATTESERAGMRNGTLPITPPSRRGVTGVPLRRRYTR